MDLAVIVLNLNTKDFLRDCLRSLSNSQLGKDRFEIIVSDNGSGDGSVQMVKIEFPSVQVVENDRNLGFAGGNNAGLRQVSGDSRYVLFLNSDTRVPPSTLPAMIKFMDENPEVGASSCYVETRDGKLDWNCHRGFPTPWSALTYFTSLHKLLPRSKLFGGYYQSYKDLRKIHEVDAVEGAFILVRREAADQIKLRLAKWWDEDFFFFGEDLDFCYRLKEKGWKIMFVPSAKIWHYKGATHGFNQQGVVEFSVDERRKLVKSTTEAMKLFYQKHYRGKYPGWLTTIVFSAIYFLGKMRLWKNGI